MDWWIQGVKEQDQEVQVGLGRLAWKQALRAGPVSRKNTCQRYDVAAPASCMMCCRAHVGLTGCPSSAAHLVSVGLVLSMVREAKAQGKNTLLICQL